jgi:hypothetical protein
VTLNQTDQAAAFREGFEFLFPIERLEGFTYQELEYLMCGAGNVDWKHDDLFENMVAAHGY